MGHVIITWTKSYWKTCTYIKQATIFVLFILFQPLSCSIFFLKTYLDALGPDKCINLYTCKCKIFGWFQRISHWLRRELLLSIINYDWKPWSSLYCENSNRFCYVPIHWCVMTTFYSQKKISPTTVWSLSIYRMTNKRGFSMLGKSKMNNTKRKY